MSFRQLVGLNERETLRVLLLRVNSPKPLVLDEEDRRIQNHLNTINDTTVRSLGNVSFADVARSLHEFR